MDKKKKQTRSGPTVSKPVRRGKFSPAMIADDLRAAIVDGDFRSGARITERAVAERFNCTAAATRESFHLLEKNGAIILSARRGARVIDREYAPPEELFIVWDRLRWLLGEELRRHDAAATFEQAPGKSRAQRLAAIESVLARLGDAARNPRLAQAMARLALHVVIVAPERLVEIEESLKR